MTTSPDPTGGDFLTADLILETRQWKITPEQFPVLETVYSLAAYFLWFYSDKKRVKNLNPVALASEWQTLSFASHPFSYRRVACEKREREAIGLGGGLSIGHRNTTVTVVGDQLRGDGWSIETYFYIETVGQFQTASNHHFPRKGFKAILEREGSISRCVGISDDYTNYLIFRPAFYRAHNADEFMNQMLFTRFLTDDFNEWLKHTETVSIDLSFLKPYRK